MDDHGSQPEKGAIFGSGEGVGLISNTLSCSQVGEEWSGRSTDGSVWFLQ